MSRPCILIIVENLPVPLDRRVWQEARALRDAGYEVVVICPQMRGCALPEEYLDGIQIYRHWISEEAGGYAGFFREYLSALWGETKLAWRAWKKHRFQIIHICNPPDLLFLVAWPLKLLRGARVIYDVHDVWPEMYEAKFGKRGFLYGLVRLAESLTYACADIVLATNESVRQIALKRGRKRPEKVFVVRTSPQINAADWPSDPRLKKERPFLVGYVGVMGSADGVHYLLDAAELLVHRQGRRDVQFILMGTGPEFGALKSRRDQKGLRDYVDMPGRVSNDFLFTALRTMDIGVSCDPINSYNNHCTMNKVLEYMAFAKAQVMFDLKEGRASAGEGALYVSETSAEKLADGIAQLLDNPVQRERLGATGAARIRTQVNWQKSVDQLLLAYEATLSTDKR